MTNPNQDDEDQAAMDKAEQDASRNYAKLSASRRPAGLAPLSPEEQDEISNRVDHPELTQPMDNSQPVQLTNEQIKELIKRHMNNGL